MVSPSGFERPWWRRLGLIGLVGLGCSAAIELDTLEDGVCPDGEKACRQMCVSEDNPNFGCALNSCTPCTLLNAVATCDTEGRCAIANCKGMFRDCDQDPQTGCEVDIIHDPQHCGSCDAAPCEFDNAIPNCGGGMCTILSCDDNWGDCNDDWDDGCETDLTTPQNCGACGVQCEPCLDGQCG